MSANDMAVCPRRPTTKLALYVEDRVLEGLWANRQAILRDLIPLGFDLILTPNFSVWRDACRTCYLE